MTKEKIAEILRQANGLQSSYGTSESCIDVCNGFRSLVTYVEQLEKEVEELRDEIMGYKLRGE